MVLVFRDDRSEGPWSSTAFRKGPWTEEEDARLSYHVGLHGDRRWDFLARVSGLRRTGKSCRLRWVNYLHPDLKRGRLNSDEERRVIELHAIWGNRWSRIAKCLPGRTDNEIKNYWRTHLRKKAQEQRRKLAAAAAAANSSACAVNNNNAGTTPGVSYSYSSTFSSSCSSNSIDCTFLLQQPTDQPVPHPVQQGATAAGRPTVLEGEGKDEGSGSWGTDDGSGSWDNLLACWEDVGCGAPGISCVSYQKQQQQSLQLDFRGSSNRSCWHPPEHQVDIRGSANPSCWPPPQQEALTMPQHPSPLWEYSTPPIWKLLNDDDGDGPILPLSCWN